MTQHLIPGEPPIPVRLRRSSRARRYSLRVPATGGDPILTLPARAPEAEALAFALSRRDWLVRHLAGRAPEVQVGDGTVLPIEGRLCRVTATSGRRIMLEDGVLNVGAQPHRIAPRVQGFLKTLARDRLAAASDQYAQALGRRYTKLDLRDTKGRWGSCSTKGRLMYSWRLVMAPPEVLDYVAAHEVAHLAEMNHGPRFWATVDRLYPGYDAPRRWLRSQGTDLHRFRFTPD